MGIFTNYSSRIMSILFLMFAPIFIWAQTVSTLNYSFTQTAGTYTPITGGSVLGTATFDSNIFPVTLPTAFTIGGVAQTAVNVSANGFITFGATAPATTLANPISSTTAYASTIAAFGADIRNAASGAPEMRWQDTGTEYVFQWKDVCRAITSNTERFSFQIRLNKTTRVISLVYDAVNTINASTTSPTIGLRGSTTADYQTRSVVTTSATAGVVNNSWLTSSTGTSTSSTCRFTNVALAAEPAVGTTWTYTPITPLAVTATAPYNEGFETAASNYDWQYCASYTSANALTYSTFAATPMAAAQANNRSANSGTKFLHSYYTATAAFPGYTWASRPLTLTSGITYQASYFFKTDGLTAWTTKMAFSTAPNTVGTDISGATTAASVSMNYSKLTGTFTVPSTGTYYIRISTFTTTTTPNYASIDDIEVKEQPACSDLASNTISAITNNSATMTWPTAATAIDYQWLVDNTPGNPTGAGTSTAAANTVNVPSLLGNTTYYAHVRAVCAAGNGAWFNSTFKTECDPTTAFNTTFLTVALTDCWKSAFSGTTSTPTVATSTTTPNTGTYSVAMYQSGTTTGNVLLVSPNVSNLAAQTHRLKFYAKGSGTLNTTIEVGTMTNPNDATTFVSFQVVTGVTTAWQQFSVPFNTYTGAGTNIAFRHTLQSTFTYTYIDDVSWEVIPTCFEPMAVVATPTNNAAAVSFTAPTMGTPVSYEVLVVLNGAGTTGAAQGSGLAVPTTTSATITGLTPNTAYQAYVRSFCGGADYSAWTGVTSFMTACDPISISFASPYVEDFESIAALNALPACWAVSNTTQCLTYNVAPGSTTQRIPHSGAKFAAFKWSNTDQHYFFSKPITLEAGKTYKTRVWYVTDGVTGWTSFVVKMATAPTPTAMNAGTGIASVGATALVAATAYTELVSPSFTVPSTGVYYFGINSIVSVSPNYMSFDDFKVEELDVCTGAPAVPTAAATVTTMCSGGSTTLTATNLPSQSGITYVWEESTNNGTTWTPSAATAASRTVTNLTITTKYRYVATCTALALSTPSNEIEVVVVTVTGGTTVASNAVVCPGATTSNTTLSLTGTPAGVTYQWKVSTDAGVTFVNATGTSTAATYAAIVTVPSIFNCVVSCGGSSATSTDVSISMLAGCVCTPIYTTGKTDGDLISNISITGTTLSNNSGTTQVNPAYTFFTGQPNYTGTLAAGTQYTVNVTVGTYGSQGIAAWIDYNDNYIFEASEKIGNTNGLIGTGTGTFPIPANHSTTFIISLACNPSPGVHRMRVRDVFNTSGALINPCTSYAYGETEDYDITVAPPPPCPQPSALTGTAVTTTGATLGWTIGCAETAWDLEILPAASTATGTPTNVGVTTNPYVATGLLPSTAYQYYVRAACGVGSSSAWSGPFNFTTLTPPPANDDPCNATTLVLDAATICQNTSGATVSAIETGSNLPTVWTGSVLNNTIWFKYTPTVTSEFYVTMNSPSASTQVMSAWTGIYTTDCAVSPLAFTQIMAPVSNNTTAGTPTNTTTPVLTAGTTYYFMIDGVAGSLGDVCIKLTAPCIASSGIGMLAANTNNLSVMCGDAGNGYTYYGLVSGGVNQYCLAVNWGTNTASKAYAEADPTRISVFKNPTGAVTSGTPSVSGTATLGYYWNIALDAANQLAAPVSVRFYYMQADLDALSTQVVATYGGTATAPIWFKTEGVPYSYSSTSVPATGQWLGMVAPATSLSQDPSGAKYAEMANITSFSGGSVAVSSGVASPLPITLKSFTATEKGAANVINWETAVEYNVRNFVVEKSNDAKTWTKLGEETPSATKRYSMIDNTPFATTYYRLKNIDKDSREDVSNVVVVNRKTGKFTITSVSPNPTNNDVNLKFETTDNANVTINVQDIFGRVVLTQQVDANKGFNTVTVTTSEIPAGAYFLSVNDGTSILTQKIVKN